MDVMDFQSAMETFAEAWVAANAGQQSQALALTRAANAAAAAAAAANAKSPSANLSDIAVKKEQSLSPPRHANLNAQTASNDEMPSPLRRPSLQGVQDKLSQLQMQQQQQQQMQPAKEEAHSPRFATEAQSSGSIGGAAGSGGGRCPSVASSPAANIEHERNVFSTASSQNASLAATPNLSEREERTNVGSISCLPPSALNAASCGPVPGLNSQATAQTEKLMPSTGPMDSRREFDVSKVNSKSLPLHCVVESVHSLQASLTIDTRNPWKRRPNIETDSYVIVAAATPWCEIVQTALQRLGYSQETAHTARGSLIIKNWKPIPLEQISDNPVVPVCDIIGELTSVVTLRIVILRAKPSAFGEIKDKLLKLLVLQSHAVLRSTGCPLDEATLHHICRSSYPNTFAFPGGELSEELRCKFDQWWSNQLSPQAPMTPKMLPFMTAPPAVPSDMDFPVGTAAVAAAAAAAAAQASLHAATNAQNVAGGNLAGMGMTAKREAMLLNDSAHHGPPVPGGGPPHHANLMVHPAMHASMHHHHHATHSQYPNQKTRMRTSFDPEMELPKLQKWFQENPHPSRQQIQTYVVQLNALESRRGRKPLDVNNVVYWFKNARAAQKRAEMRGGLSAMGALGHAAMNGYLSQHGLHGQSSGSNSVGSLSGNQQLGGNLGGLSMTHDYLKSPLSLKSEDIDNMSQHSDDIDDDHSRACSPQLPLSLTTHERNRTTPADDEGEHADTRGDSLAKDETESRDLLNGSVNQNERYDEDGGDKQHKEYPASAPANQHENSDDRSLCQPHDAEANNNSTHSNNNNNSGNESNDTPAEKEQNALLKRASPKEEEEDLDMDDDDEDNENDTSHLDGFRSPSPDMTNMMAPRKDLPFPMVHNSMFSQSFMYMSHYMPGFSQAAGHPHMQHAAAAAAAASMQPSPLMGTSGINLSSLSNEERRKRNRTFIDPVTEVPKLEQWFAMNTHPSHNLILKYTEDLNTMPYRQKFPRLESKNVQFWFKNRRAKCKRLKMSLYDSSQCSQLSGLNSFVHKYDDRD